MCINSKYDVMYILYPTPITMEPPAMNRWLPSCVPWRLPWSLASFWCCAGRIHRSTGPLSAAENFVCSGSRPGPLLPCRVSMCGCGWVMVLLKPTLTFVVCNLGFTLGTLQYIGGQNWRIPWPVLCFAAVLGKSSKRSMFHNPNRAPTYHDCHLVTRLLQAPALPRTIYNTQMYAHMSLQYSAILYIYTRIYWCIRMPWLATSRRVNCITSWSPKITSSCKQELHELQL